MATTARRRPRTDHAAARAAAIPAITYPSELPVSARRDEIAAAIREHQVVVVAGETGSGKTTQLPKICLELGRGRRGLIGHTQPRRLAARTVAARIADELGVALGEAIGYEVRFEAVTSERTAVKLMTDGILLTEIQRDRELRRYDTIIIDEAHERSLNVDFLLGYLKQLLPRRPDLKVIITSATIDPQRFAEHFADLGTGGPAPIVEVSGRTYPVEVRYRPVVDPEDPDTSDTDVISGIVAACDELRREGPGDILVFLSGEREIRDVADVLRGHVQSWPANERVEVLPLYSRLAAAEQSRVFAPHSSRRIVLATNVAETSLTVPGIHYVIDPGTARISRYSARTKVQRLPIEAIAQASANQRAGRCGRVADGVCIRLYSAEDFGARPEFTQPEILRTNLAAVILQMAALRLGDLADFPFVEPPDRRQVADGVAVLQELGALDERGRLTGVGRSLAQLPVDPRLGRMILAAGPLGCVRDVLVVASALAIQDPRERPADAQEAADTAHRRFADPTSDFLTLIALWKYLREQQKALSGNAFRRLCRREYLNYLRVREWQDVEAQLRRVAASLGLPRASGWADGAAVHQAVLAGLLSHIGWYDERARDYQGARGTRFTIFPGSALARGKARPDWIVAAELVETARLFARVCAKIDPAWAETAAGPLARRTYSEPRWSRKRAAVVATEKVTVFGLPVVAARTVNYGSVDPQLARELFIRHALVEGDWIAPHQFLRANAALRAEIEAEEERTRQRGLVADDETLVGFYDARIPADVVSGRHFDAWWKRTRPTDPDRLTMAREDLRSALDGDDALPEDFPQQWTDRHPALPLSYVFDPGDPADGVTVHVPLALVGQLDPVPFEWLVPGLREELVTALIRGLPKPIRRNVVPAPDVARAFLAGPGAAGPAAGALRAVLADTLREWRGVSIRADDWPAELPAHLQMSFRVEDEAGQVVATGSDLVALRSRLGGAALAEVAGAAGDVQTSGHTRWDFGVVPAVFETVRGGHTVRAYPAVVDEGESVGVRLVAEPAEQRAASRAGVRRLIALALPSPMAAAVRGLSAGQRLALSQAPHPSAAALLNDVLVAAIDAAVGAAEPRDAEAFAALLDRCRVDVPARAAAVLSAVAAVLEAYRAARLGVDTLATDLPATADLQAQLVALVHPGFVAETTAARLADLRRYLEAVAIRAETAPRRDPRDAAHQATVELLQHDYADVVAGLPPPRRSDPDVVEVGWLLQELRVSYFAQRLGTRVPVSDQRLRRAIAAL